MPMPLQGFSGITDGCSSSPTVHHVHQKPRKSSTATRCWDAQAKENGNENTYVVGRFFVIKIDKSEGFKAA